MVRPTRGARRERAASVVGVLGVAILLSTASCARQPSPYDSFSDSGPAADVAAVREALPDLLQREDSVGRVVVDASGAVTEELNLSPAAVAQRREELSQVATPARVTTDLPVIERGMAELVKDSAAAESLAYTAAQIKVDAFRGIAVDGDRTTAVLRSSECYTRLDATENCGPPSDTRVTLERASSGDWQIASRSSRYVPRQAP